MTGPRYLSTVFVLATLLATALAAGCTKKETPKPPPETEIDAVQEPLPARALEYPTQSTVVVVIDGDTVRLRNGEVLRYIGLDAPETHQSDIKSEDYYGKAAFEFNKELVLGKKVRIEYDELPQDADDKPRLLGYVFIDDVLVNERILEEGHAMAASFPPNTKYAARFACAEAKARAAKKGLWGFDPKEMLQQYEIYLNRKMGSDYPGVAKIAEVIDGDTAMLEFEDGLKMESRLIGIDAPETVGAKYLKDYFGKESYEYFKKNYEGKKVSVTYDVTNLDRKKRLLVYLWEGSTLINAELVKAGYALVSTFPPNVAYLVEFIDAQEEAAKNGAGLWKSTPTSDCR